MAWAPPVSVSIPHLSGTPCCTRLGGKLLHPGLVHISASPKRKGNTPIEPAAFGPWSSHAVVLGSCERRGKSGQERLGPRCTCGPLRSQEQVEVFWNVGIPCTGISYAGRGPPHPEPTTRSHHVWRSTVVWVAPGCYAPSSKAPRYQGRGPGDRVRRQSGA